MTHRARSNRNPRRLVACRSRAPKWRPRRIMFAVMTAGSGFLDIAHPFVIVDTSSAARHPRPWRLRVLFLLAPDHNEGTPACPGNRLAASQSRAPSRAVPPANPQPDGTICSRTAERPGRWRCAWRAGSRQRMSSSSSSSTTKASTGGFASCIHRFAAVGSSCFASHGPNSSPARPAMSATAPKKMKRKLATLV